MGIALFIAFVIAGYYGLRRPAGHAVGYVSPAQSERDGNYAARANGI